MNAQRLRDAIERAENAFWDSIAGSFPEATGGDTSPEVDVEFSKVAESAVEDWVEANVPPERIYWRFDVYPVVFRGVALAGKWNGYDNLKVDEATHATVVATLAEKYGVENVEELQTLPVENGWVDYSGGFATQIVPKSMALSLAFARHLLSWIGEINYAEMLGNNRKEVASLRPETRDREVCHSHDYCDANVVMEEAFRAVFGRDPDREDPTDADLWNEAWADAKEYRFQEVFDDNVPGH